MKLLVKFNLIFLLVMLLGLGASSWITRDLLQANAREEVLNNARLMMEKALAVRSYTSNQITKLLQTQMKYEFLPQSIPSFSAVEVLGKLQTKYPDFSYKEATLNPTNPRDRAVGWEVDIVSQFRANAELKESVGQRDTPSGASLFVARPLRITDPACLQCHSSVDAAPKTMVDKYGPANGFGWQLNEVVGAQVVSVPMALPLARAEKSFQVFMAAQVGVFVAVGIVLNLMIWLLIVRPVLRLADIADRVSQGELDAPEFGSGGKDEIGVLAASFSRMRASVVQAMKMLDS
jgi:HAMP domain-containing protein